MDKKALKNFLDRKVEEYNKPSFIAADPIAVPHSFSKKQDIEIAGFFAAIFAWGIRTTIIRKATELMKLMDNSPHDFIVNHQEEDRRRLEGFCHRTFNDTDLLYFVSFLQHHYKKYNSLENAFVLGTSCSGSHQRSGKKVLMLPETLAPVPGTSASVSDDRSNIKHQPDNRRNNLCHGDLLNYFYTYFFSLQDVPNRTRKHIAAPMKNSACKRINMFLRWMVRDDNKGVDFGIWKKIKPSELVCPLDLHVARVAKKFKLIDRPNSDWQSAVDLTQHLRRFDPQDPVKYDFALFALGVAERF